MDEAAAVLIAALADTAERGEAITAVQRYLELDPLPGNREFSANYAALLGRDDVKAAVDKVGRSERHEIYGVFSTD